MYHYKVEDSAYFTPTYITTQQKEKKGLKIRVSIWKNLQERLYKPTDLGSQ